MIVLTMVKLYVNYILVALLMQILYSGAAGGLVHTVGFFWLLIMIMLTGMELMLGSVFDL